MSIGAKLSLNELLLYLNYSNHVIIIIHAVSQSSWSSGHWLSTMDHCQRTQITEYSLLAWCCKYNRSTVYIRSTCVTCVELCYFTPEVLSEMEEWTIVSPPLLEKTTILIMC